MREEKIFPVEENIVLRFFYENDILKLKKQELRLQLIL